MEKRGILETESSCINNQLAGIVSKKKALEWPEALTWEMVPATEQETRGEGRVTKKREAT